MQKLLSNHQSAGKYSNMLNFSIATSFFEKCPHYYRSCFILLVGPTWLNVVLCVYTQVMSENTMSNRESRLIILVESSNQSICLLEEQDKEARKPGYLIQDCCSFFVCSCTALHKYPLTYKLHLFAEISATACSHYGDVGSLTILG